jgi:Ricin-type beta-trefoil lectin domain
MMRALTRFAVGLGAVALATVGITAPAQAADLTRQYLNNHFALCLDSNTAKKVYLHGCNSGNFQRWTWNSSNLRLKNVSTGFCLDSDSGGNVYTGGCQNNNNFQKWRKPSSTSYQWANVATGLCLDVKSNQTVYTHACNTGDYQWWLPQI